ncbi:DUF4296 domain-containing protein [Draconibacterium sp.]|nr:DUF4296 domain-containing protein [Draconibacterium sp.]
MKRLFTILSIFLVTFVSCDKLPIEKPENLIKEKKMIDMLVDIHIAEATYRHMQYDSTIRNSSSANFYYSILDKHQVPDSVFEKSFVFYASSPKQFEKMYQDVMNKLSQVEQKYSGRKNELLEFEDPDEIQR